MSSVDIKGGGGSGGSVRPFAGGTAVAIFGNDVQTVEGLDGTD
jgi:hypothetical protein